MKDILNDILWALSKLSDRITALESDYSSESNWDELQEIWNKISKLEEVTSGIDSPSSNC